MDKIEKTEYEWKEEEFIEQSMKPLKILMGILLLITLLLLFVAKGEIAALIVMGPFWIYSLICYLGRYSKKPSRYIGQCPYCKNEISFANGETYRENDQTLFYSIQKEIPDKPIGVNCKFCQNRIIIKDKYFHPISSKVEVDKGMKKCLFCAELIKEEAKLCRYCNREQE